MCEDEDSSYQGPTMDGKTKKATPTAKMLAKTQKTLHGTEQAQWEIEKTQSNAAASKERQVAQATACLTICAKKRAIKNTKMQHTPPQTPGILQTGKTHLALLGGHVVCNLGRVGLVVHEQNLQLGSVVDNELLEARGKNELGLLVGAVTDVGHRCVALEAPAHSAVNAMGLAPRAIKAKPQIRLESVEGLVRTLLHDIGTGSRLRSHGELQKRSKQQRCNLRQRFGSGGEMQHAARM